MRKIDTGHVTLSVGIAGSPLLMTKSRSIARALAEIVPSRPGVYLTTIGAEITSIDICENLRQRYESLSWIAGHPCIAHGQRQSFGSVRFTWLAPYGPLRCRFLKEFLEQQPNPIKLD